MDFQLDYDMDVQNNRWNVTLAGEIDIFDSPELKARLTALLEEKDADLYLQCKNLEYIDSTGLGALVGVLKTVNSNGREMHLISIKPNIQKLFKITNLDKVFILEDGVDNGQ